VHEAEVQSYGCREQAEARVTASQHPLQLNLALTTQQKPHRYFLYTPLCLCLPTTKEIVAPYESKVRR
jgi:hypothetical protein